MKVESLADGARRHIQEWIATGEFKPGQRLKEEEISQRLEISRPPVREAFKMLEAEGLVVRKPRCGVIVTEMTAKDVWEVYTLKATLYEMATELALQTITAPEIKALETLVEKMAVCVKKDTVDLLHYQDLHRSFHIKILDIAGNGRLKKMASNLHQQIRRYSYQTLQDRAHLESSVWYHRKIVRAMAERQSKSACRLMKAHVFNALEILLDIPAARELEQAALPPWKPENSKRVSLD